MAEKPTPSDAAAPAKGGGLIGALKARYWLLLAVTGGAALLGIPLVLFLVAGRQSPIESAPPFEVEEALEALDTGDLNQAQLIAERYLKERSLPSEKRSIPRFVLGLIKCRTADGSWHRNTKRHRLVAIAHLRAAREDGFPKGREADGLFFLGQNLLLAGYVAESREVLQEALPLNPARRTEILRFLAESFRLGSQVNLETSSHYIDELLAAEEISSEQREDAMLLKSQLALAGGNVAECAAFLARIPAESPLAAEVEVMRGRILLAEGSRHPSSDAAQPAPEPQPEKLQQAIELLRQAQRGDTPRRLTSAKAMYLIGLALVEQDEIAAALKQLQRTRLLHSETPEGLAADLLEADLLARQSEDDEALAGYRRTVAAAGPPAAFSNPWLTAEELATRLLEAYQRWLDAEMFPRAIEMARSCYPVVAQARAVELEAEALRLWGRRELERSTKARASEAEPLATQGRGLLRKAGSAFYRLAELEFEDRKYPEDLWAAADCFFDGCNYTRSTELLRQYRKNESRRRQAAALRRLGEAELALGEYPAAIAAFEECIDSYPKDVEVYESRLLEAKARIEMEQPQEAERLLLANLTSDTLAPASREWRAALLELGRLLTNEGRDAEAIDKLEEWVERYPQAAEIHEAQYLLAVVHRRQALAHSRQSEQEQVESARLTKIREARAHFDAALLHYSAVLDGLGSQLDRRQLDAAAIGILRNAHFARGTTLFELGRYEEAIEAYSMASNRYQHSPEVLDAYVQISACYRRLQKPLEARGSLEQAKVALARLPAETNFTAVTNYDRNDWAALLDWLKTL